MKKSLVLAIGFFLILGIGGVSAESSKKFFLEFRPEISHISYKESDIKEEGTMYGVAGLFAYRNKIMLRAEGRVSFGQVDYSNSEEINNIDDYMLEFRGLVGYDFPVLKSSQLTPYIGIGYRYLNDAFDYERESGYLYSPIGVEFLTPLGNRWSILLTGEYDLFWYGKQKSYLSDILPGLNDIENRQKNGYGWRGSIIFQKEYKKVIFEGGPFIRYWNIKKSEEESITYLGYETGYIAWEPKNKSTEIGLLVGIKF